MRATKKPITIDYFPLSEEHKASILEWTTDERPIVIVTFENEPKRIYAEITTLEGVMTAVYGDMIIKGVNGEVYPCKLDIFEKTYRTEKSEWQKTFLDKGTEIIGKDLSAMIPVVSDILYE